MSAARKRRLEKARYPRSAAVSRGPAAGEASDDGGTAAEPEPGTVGGWRGETAVRWPVMETRRRERGRGG